MSTNDKNSGQKLVTPKFRVSYPKLFKPGQYGKNAPKYEITMLIAKTADLTPFKNAIKAAKVKKFGPDKSKWPAEINSPVVDGDAPKHSKKEGYKGHWAIKASALEDYKPTVVDKDMEEITNAKDIYPGCYARAQVFCSVWEFEGKFGVKFSLDHVQKLADGKPFGGRTNAADAFEPYTEEDEDTDENESEEDDDSGF